MEYIIDGIDFYNIEAEKYWTHPPSQQARAAEETKQMILSNNYLGARKMDGCYERFLKDEDGNMYLIARSRDVRGNVVNKIEWVPQLQPFFDGMPKGTCFLGEIYFPNNEGSRHVTTIMGCLKDKAIARQADDMNKLHYYIFDVWAWEGKSCMKMKAEDRFNLLSGISNTHAYNHFNFVEFAQYYIGPALWDELVRVRAADGEGIVITKSDSIPAPGKRVARKTLKIKKELDNPIDCFLTGRFKVGTMDYNGDYVENWQYWYNVRTGDKFEGNYYEDYHNGATIIPVTKAWFNNWASAIEIGVLNGDKEISLGWISGIPEEVKEGIASHNSEWKHRVVKVNAMEIDKENMALRHGKIIEWRAPGDKDWRECSIDQI